MPEEESCPICNSECEVTESGFNKNINCPSCGPYSISKIQGCPTFPQNTQHLIAGYLYETKMHIVDLVKSGATEGLVLNEGTIQEILSDPLIPKRAMQYLDKIILNLYKRNEGFLTMVKADCFMPAMGYARSKQELVMMFNALRGLGYLDERNILTIKGLQYAESLLTSNRNSTNVFIAMKFFDELKALRESAIKPACQKCGFTAFTVDEEEHNDDIPDKIISGIKTSRFVVADFTENNLGVYYEAGYAKGLGLPVIKTCKKEWFDKIDESGNRENKLHFDIEHDNLILWVDSDDFAKKLEARIRATIL
ncbi:MAG: hypothetical protein Q7J08_07140 [Methanocorpusculum sp.]|uniref:hypothetical protein n=1 Tax=Methanocorpusculum sp. TaxID=2058474 RepID=UPI002719F15C|nr:hypothetical protein [Methanocorpusculum sp.]MDO9523468.1 hypothetical protein [Methanocorpusculum sp.]